MECIAVLEPGDTSSLFTLLDRLSDRKAWTVIDGLSATRLADRFNQEAVLGQIPPMTLPLGFRRMDLHTWRQS